MTTNSVCPKCGSIEKSGKMSCCGHGGSWFENCGNTGNTKLDHTWYEGIQTCNTRAQSKRASGQQPDAAQQLHSRNSSEMASSKTVIATTFARPSVTNTPADIPMRARAYTRQRTMAARTTTTTDSTTSPVIIDTDPSPRTVTIEFTITHSRNSVFNERAVSESAFLCIPYLHLSPYILYIIIS